MAGFQMREKGFPEAGPSVRRPVAIFFAPPLLMRLRGIYHYYDDHYDACRDCYLLLLGVLLLTIIVIDITNIISLIIINDHYGYYTQSLGASSARLGAPRIGREGGEMA